MCVSLGTYVDVCDVEGVAGWHQAESSENATLHLEDGFLSGQLKIQLHKGLKKASLYLDFVPALVPFLSASSFFPLRCALQSASQIRVFIPSLPSGISPPEHRFHLPQLL